MKRDIICGIYKITSPSGKVYIGQSIDIEKRICSYKKLKAIGQRKLHHSLVKYGWEAHTFEIIHICQKRSLNKWELFYITEFECLINSKGLNLRAGGSRGEVHAETRAIMSKNTKERFKDPVHYKKVVDQLTSIDRQGSKNPKYGTGRRVVQFDLEGNYLNTFISCCEAGNFIKRSYNSILRCCNKNVKAQTYKKHIWRFEKDCVIMDSKLQENLNLRVKTSPKDKKLIKPPTSKYKGVRKNHNKWEARYYNKNLRKTIQLGTYTKETDAARAYNIKYREITGVDLPMNKIKNPFKSPIKNKGMSKQARKIWLEKLSMATAGKNNPRYGVKLSLITKNRISMALTDNPKTCKPILKYSLSEKFIQEYSSVKNALISVEVKSANSLLDCCKGRRNNAHGFIWKYKNAA